MSTDALLAKRPRLRPDVVCSRPLRRGPATVYLLKDRANGKAYEIAARELFVISRLDGARSLGDIGEEYARSFGRRLGADHWTRLLWLLHERALLAGAGGAMPAGGPMPSRDAVPARDAKPARDTEPAGGGTPATSAAGATSDPAGATSDPVSATSDPAGATSDAGGALDRWTRRLWPLCTAPGFAVAIALGLAALAVTAVRLPSVWSAARPTLGRPWLLVLLAVTAWASAALHEFAHGVAARHSGAAVTRINLLTLTCRVEDYLYLPSRGAQIAIAAAGGVANGLVLVPFAIVWLLRPQSGFAAAYLLVGAVQTLINFVPLAPLDGYKMVGHATGSLDLAVESRRWLLRLPRRSRPAYPSGTVAVLAGYLVVWLICVGALATGFVLAGSHFLRGELGGAALPVPIVIACLTIAGWLARPSRPALPTRTSTDRAPASAESSRTPEEART